ncbi:hypothetical protein FBU59_004686 [Linderina macrospora]|uniref:Uncharacterized protein n=1 Tax=Linderina macrospora TaxID=4868 RepID=A0ACC1J4V0_9FUNG|nr:hypothetical protein FBU59_004686 [Linderina macrospora]
MAAKEDSDTVTACSAAGIHGIHTTSSDNKSNGGDGDDGTGLHDDISDFSASPSATSTKRKRSLQPSSQESSTDIDSFIAEMVAQRNQLRGRFKEWADQVERTTKRLKHITDNALVNQSGRLESILDEGKKKVDGIISEQNQICTQLSSFMSLLASAQEQVFNKKSTAMPK